MPRNSNRISRLKVRGFKSLSAEQHIDIRPLTVLAGANSSGKSSIMQPLLLLKQTIEAVGDPGAILLDGDHVKFASTEQLLSRPAGGRADSSFCVVIGLHSGESLSLEFQRQEGKGFDVKTMEYAARREHIKIDRSMSHDAIQAILPEPWKKVYANFAEREKEKYRWSVVRDRCLLAFDLRSEAGPGVFGPGNISPSASFVPHIKEVIHLPGLRGNPQRVYPKTAVGARFQGTFGPYVASVIDAWQAEKNHKLEDLGRDLETLGLTWKVRAERVDDTRLQLKVGRLAHAKRGGAHDMVSIADVGVGVSQALPVLVSLLVARPGQLVYLEQPEIHLHPIAQRRLANILRDAVESGVVVVVETHSSLLLREIQTLVASGDIEPKDVALHWFTRDEDGCTSISTAEPDENGAYGDWPADFDRMELQSEQAYLDAVESHGINK